MLAGEADIILTLYVQSLYDVNVHSKKSEAMDDVEKQLKDALIQQVR